MEQLQRPSRRRSKFPASKETISSMFRLNVYQADLLLVKSGTTNMANTHGESVHPDTSTTLVLCCWRESYFFIRISLRFIIHFENYPGSLFCLNLKPTILTLLYYRRQARLQKEAKIRLCLCLLAQTSMLYIVLGRILDFYH